MIYLWFTLWTPINPQPSFNITLPIIVLIFPSCIIFYNFDIFVFLCAVNFVCSRGWLTRHRVTSSRHGIASRLGVTASRGWAIECQMPISQITYDDGDGDIKHFQATKNIKLGHKCLTWKHQICKQNGIQHIFYFCYPITVSFRKMPWQQLWQQQIALTTNTLTLTAYTVFHNVLQ